MKKRILVVEDDAALARVLCDNLVLEGFEVQWVADGNLALDISREFLPDLVLLDIMLPGRNGFELCTWWSQGQQTPVVFLTARGQKVDRLRGLKLGADDYITKPFDLEELLARIHVVLRRSRPNVERLVLGSATIDFLGLQAWNGRREIELTHREFELLRYLAERPEKVVSRLELLHNIWGYAETPHTRAVDHAIARLRKKIEPDPHQPRFIHTVHGDGYCLTPQGRSVPEGG